VDHDEHVRLLGAAVGRSQQLELATTQVLARVLGVVESTARTLSGGMGMSRTLDCLQTLADRRDCRGLPHSSVAAWLPQARLANTVRNRVIHAPWIIGGDSGESSVLRRDSTLERRTLEDLREDLDTLTVAVRQVVELLATPQPQPTC
jgi:hypothetical protein